MPCMAHRLSSHPSQSVPPEFPDSLTFRTHAQCHMDPSGGMRINNQLGMNESQPVDASSVQKGFPKRMLIKTTESIWHPPRDASLRITKQTEVRLKLSQMSKPQVKSGLVSSTSELGCWTSAVRDLTAFGRTTPASHLRYGEKRYAVWAFGLSVFVNEQIGPRWSSAGS